MPSHLPAPDVVSLAPYAHTQRPVAEPPVESPPPRRPLRAPLVLALCFASAAVAFGLTRGAVGARQPARVETRIAGVAPPRTTDQGTPQRWQKREVTVAIDESVSRLGPAAHEAALQAFGTWLGAGTDLPELRFDTTRKARSSLRADGVSSIFVAPIDLPGHEMDLAVTITFSNADTGEIIESDIWLNARHVFGSLDEADPARKGAAHCAGAFDVQSVLTHEVGHFFGLGEDGDDSSATMSQKTSACTTSKRVLTDADRTAIAQLYAEGFEDERSAGCAVHRPVRGSTPASAVLFAALAACLLRRRAR
jgi:hypothetical protein